MLQSFFMGVGLAMDATCVSMTNGLTERNMKITKILFIAFLFGLFQTLMPVLGYFLGGFFTKYIQKFIPLIALIVLTILGGKMIIETLREKKHNTTIPKDKSEQEVAAESESQETVYSDKADDNALTDETVNCSDIETNDNNVSVASESQSVTIETVSTENVRKIKAKEIIIQAIATSIDAFSIGVLYIGESIKFAMLSFMIFGIVTMLLCIPAVFIGKKFGVLFKDKAGIIGGVILIAIGLKIFIQYIVETL